MFGFLLVICFYLIRRGEKVEENGYLFNVKFYSIRFLG